MFADLFATLVEYAALMSGGNALIQAGIIAWVGGVLTWSLRGIPRALYEFLKRNLLTTMVFDDAGYRERWVMTQMLVALQSKITDNTSRSLLMTPNMRQGCEHTPVISSGYGFHWFTHNSRLFWFYMSKLESSAAENQKREITLYTYGRSHKPFHDLIESTWPKEEPNQRRIYNYQDGDFAMVGSFPRRDVNNMAIDSAIKASIMGHIEKFLASEEEFVRRGIPWKLVFLLHGKAGSGKTSIATSMADHFKYDIAQININSIGDAGLNHAIMTHPKKAFITIDDIDCLSALHKRENGYSDAILTARGDDSISLSGVLNVFSGNVPLHGSVIFMTTNHLDVIDTAVYRAGRVEHIYELSEVPETDVKEWASRMFPSHNNWDGLTDSMACDMFRSLSSHHNDAEAFKKDLIETNNSKKIS